MPIPHSRFDKMHADIVGPFIETEEGYQYILSIQDRHTRWFEKIPIKKYGSTNDSRCFFKWLGPTFCLEY